MQPLRVVQYFQIRIIPLALFSDQRHSLRFGHWPLESPAQNRPLAFMLAQADVYQHIVFGAKSHDLIQIGLPLYLGQQRLATLIADFRQGTKPLSR